MTILVTGGAGFIGASFVNNWLACNEEPVVNLDRLTYAGNLNNLAPFDADSRHVFVQGDVRDSELLAQLFAARRPRAGMRPRADGRSYIEQIAFVPGRHGHDRHDRRYAVDTTRIRDERGWQPQESFENAIRRTTQWYLDHAGGWQPPAASSQGRSDAA